MISTRSSRDRSHQRPTYSPHHPDTIGPHKGGTGEGSMATLAPEELRPDPTPSDIRLVIAASSVGTLFEWYDIFIYGTLSSLIGKAFFQGDNVTLQPLLV